MNIVILGAGEIGSYLAKKLSSDEHNVVVIDCDVAALERLSRSADIATRLGSGTNWELLEELMEISPDLFLALSNNDETNLTACTIAKNLGYPKTAARIRQKFFLNSSRLDFGRLFFVDHILGTEMMVAQDIFKSIIDSGNLAVENFARGTVQMRTIVVPSTFEHAGKALSQINLSDKLLIGLIRRTCTGQEPKIIFPKGHDQLLPGDEATLIGDTSTMRNLHEIFGLPKQSVGTAVIAGICGVSIHLCRLLLQQHITVKIIEADEQKCQMLAKILPEVMILNHDGTDIDFLYEERIHNADVFVACTPSQELNILISALAKRAGNKQVIAVISDENFYPLLKQLGIKSTFSERANVAKRIDAILQDDSIVSVASLYDNQAKIMELKISMNSNIVGSPISDINHVLPENFLIALIENRSGITIPTGNNVLTPGDTAIVICSPEALVEVEKIV